MKRLQYTIASLVIGCLAFVLCQPAWPQEDGGEAPTSKEDDVERREARGRPRKPTKGINPDDLGEVDPGALGEEGEIPWIVPREAKELLTLEMARKALKPVLAYFWKSPALPTGKKKKPPKDAQAKASEGLNDTLWADPMVAETAVEFLCFLVDVRTATPDLLRKYKVAKAPVVVLFDFELKQAFRTKSPRIAVKTMLKAMADVEKKWIAEIEKIAKKPDDTLQVTVAKERLNLYEQRGLFRKGRKMLLARQWKKARELFEKGIDVGLESYWQDRCGQGCGEVDAGKAFQQAEFLCKKKKYKKAKEILEHILSFWGYDDAPYFSALAQERLEWVKKKLE